MNWSPLCQILLADPWNQLKELEKKNPHLASPCSTFLWECEHLSPLRFPRGQRWQFLPATSGNTERLNDGLESLHGSDTHTHTTNLLSRLICLSHVMLRVTHLLKTNKTPPSLPACSQKNVFFKSKSLFLFGRRDSDDVKVFYSGWSSSCIWIIFHWDVLDLNKRVKKMNEWIFWIYTVYLFLGLTSWFILETHKYADCE